VVSATILISAPSAADPDFQRTLDSARRVRGAFPKILVVSPRAFSEEETLSTTLRNPRVEIHVGSVPSALAHVDTDFVVWVPRGAALDEKSIVELGGIFEGAGADVVYGDNEAIPLPEWSPYRYGASSYLNGVIAFRPSAIAAIRPGMSVLHVNKVLVRDVLPGSVGLKEISSSLKRFALSTRGTKTVRSVAIVIPTCGSRKPEVGHDKPLINALLASLMPLSPSVAEIIVVADQSTPADVVEEVRKMDRVRVITYDRPFNFADKCNVGALDSESDVVMFLNDDMVALTSEWPEVVLRYLSDAAVGAVGGLLVSPDGRVQCAGHGNAPVPHLFGVGLDPDDPANFAAVGQVREVGGLSGACLAVRREDYLKVGGMCTQFPSSYNDVDLGFKLLSEGLNLLYTPEFRFVHYESASRDPQLSVDELELLRRRWGRFLERESYPVVQN